MQTSRRNILAFGLALALVAAGAAAQRGGLRGHMPSLGGQQGQSPATADPTDPVKPDPRTLLKLKQEEIKKQVQHLYDLAGQLKQETDSTHSADVLSLSVLKKAEEIQKTAKRIQSLVRD